jgi:hypothetical protein
VLRVSNRQVLRGRATEVGEPASDQATAIAAADGTVAPAAVGDDLGEHADYGMPSIVG